ncbi:TPA: hypothetical protein I7126_08515 [Vibrio vulnificus]|nr:hypothetical protein [Vibrio vulnificus]HAS6029041.1 hypothetical protein [Vibrio vulnificus]HAS6114543.1 hypothetical protein [Vibrio vulnificus]HAS6123670.1 hypothetical protein [Vibrio vulnificus]HAS6127447.1 hypothetical protein [Vibrio vulnificus]
MFFQEYHEVHQKRESENTTKLGIPTHLKTNIRKSMESSRYENDDVDFRQHEKGQIRVTNGVSCDSARMTKSMEKLYLRGQF